MKVLFADVDGDVTGRTMARYAVAIGHDDMGAVAVVELEAGPTQRSGANEVVR